MPKLSGKTHFVCAGVASLALVMAGSAEAARGGGGFRGGGGGAGMRSAPTNIQGPSGTLNGNRNANFNGNANINRNTNVNRNVNRNVNIDVDNNWNHGCCGYNHPVAAGMAFGAAAALTAAAIGSMAYSLPPACVPRAYPAATYYSCDGVWYQPQYAGTQVTYVVVENPG